MPLFPQKQSLPLRLVMFTRMNMLRTNPTQVKGEQEVRATTAAAKVHGFFCLPADADQGKIGTRTKRNVTNASLRKAQKAAKSIESTKPRQVFRTGYSGSLRPIFLFYPGIICPFQITPIDPLNEHGALGQIDFFFFDPFFPCKAVHGVHRNIRNITQFQDFLFGVVSTLLCCFGKKGESFCLRIYFQKRLNNIHMNSL